MVLPAINPTGVFSAFITPVDSSAGTGITGALSQVPPNTNEPIIFEPYWTLTDGIPEVWIMASGGIGWGGCQVFVSLENTTYGQIGYIQSGAAQGLLSATFPSGSDPDTVNTLSVDLSESTGQLISWTTLDADFALPSLAYCDGELIAFSNTTLTSANNYDLDTYIRRGCYKTTIGSHLTGTLFAQIQSPFSFAYPVTLIGATVWFKFPSFNSLGGELQDVSTCIAYPYVLTGFGLRPLGITVQSETTDYTITFRDDAKHFDNCGAAMDIVLTLPLAESELIYSFLVCEPFYLKVLASGSDVISRGSGDDSAAGGYIRSNLPFSFITIESHEAGHWIVATQVGTWGIDV